MEKRCTNCKTHKKGAVIICGVMSVLLALLLVGCSSGNNNAEVKTDIGTVTPHETPDSGTSDHMTEDTETSAPETVHIHAFGAWTDNGNTSNHSRSCSCGERENGEHSFDSGKVTKEPTSAANGIKTYTCTICGASKVETIEYVGYEAPYCPGDFSKIEKKFSTFHVAGSGLQYGSGSLAILLKQQYALNSPGQGSYYECWDAYTDYNGYKSRVGVYNDRIVFNIQDIGSGVKVSEALTSDLLAIEPLIIYGCDDKGKVKEQMLIWKGDNGYMIAFAEARGYPNGSYLNEYIDYVITTVDLMHIHGIPQQVHDDNPAF